MDLNDPEGSRLDLIGEPVSVKALAVGMALAVAAYVRDRPNSEVTRKEIRDAIDLLVEAVREMGEDPDSSQLAARCGGPPKFTERQEQNVGARLFTAALAGLDGLD